MYNLPMTTILHGPEPAFSDTPIGAWLDALAAATPAPGGGAAAALAGAMSAALIAMVAGLTLGRPRYAAAHAEMSAVSERAAALRQALTQAAADDTAAYLALMAAYRLPKADDAQQADRQAAIQAALRRAAEVPLAAAEACSELLELATAVAARGNLNASSDAAVAALLAHAGLQGAVRNVRINLNDLEAAAFRQEAAARTAQLLETGTQALVAALAAADARR